MSSTSPNHPLSSTGNADLSPSDDQSSSDAHVKMTNALPAPVTTAPVDSHQLTQAIIMFLSEIPLMHFNFINLQKMKCWLNLD